MKWLDIFPCWSKSKSLNFTTCLQNDAEWEAELEGELNEYEMVGGEEGEELNEDQIQALLEAEK